MAKPEEKQLQEKVYFVFFFLVNLKLSLKINLRGVHGLRPKEKRQDLAKESAGPFWALGIN